MHPFDRTTDAGETWYLDLHQCPEPAGPLAQSAYPYMFRGYVRGQRDRGQHKPAILRHLFKDGYFYVSFTPPGGPLAPEAQAEARRSAERWEREWLPEIQANLTRLNGLDLETMPNDGLGAVLDDALRTLSRHWEIHFTLTFAVVNEWEKWYRNRFPDADATEAQQLIQGQTNETVDADRALWQLSTPAVRAALEAGDRSVLSDFLARVGGRPAVYCDLGAATWAEDPTPVIQLIKKYADVPAPLPQTEALLAARTALEADVRSRLAPDELPAFDDLLMLTRKTVQMKENHSFWIEQQTTGAVRRVCVEIGRRMAAAGILAAPGEVSLVTVAELLGFTAGQVQSHLPVALAERRAAQAANRQVVPAPWTGAAPEDEEETAPIQGATAWQGMGVSAGVARGRARVANTLADAYQIQPGEILICTETDPGWTPLFAMAGGLVLSTFAGGMLAHAAVVAREYRLPAVVRADGILTSVRTGQKVEVNGSTGEVKLIEE